MISGRNLGGGETAHPAPTALYGKFVEFLEILTFRTAFSSANGGVVENLKVLSEI
jgi:hypothetical protein